LVQLGKLLITKAAFRLSSTIQQPWKETGGLLGTFKKNMAWWSGAIYTYLGIVDRRIRAAFSINFHPKSSVQNNGKSVLKLFASTYLLEVAAGTDLEHTISILDFH
jgi:hypothetical protein